MGSALSYSGYGLGFVVAGVLSGLFAWMAESGIQSLISKQAWILPLVFGFAGGAVYLILVGKLLF